MISTKLASISLAASLAAILPAVAEQAQAPRTFVSAAGNDSNPCTFAAPCRHFQNAVNVTSAGGEVDALDPAGYGPIVISQPITIEGQGWSYIAPPASGNGITINAVSGNVAIHGVSLNGVGIAGSTTGIAFTSGGSLDVRDSFIRNFINGGIAFGPGTASQLSVSNTLVSDNGGSGILIDPSGTGTVAGILEHVAMERNTVDGLRVQSSTAQTLNFTVSDSVSADNSHAGILAVTDGSTIINVMVRNSTLFNNLFGVVASAAGAGVTVRVTRSTITDNASAWSIAGSGVVTSYADNNIDGNGGNNSTPASTASYH